MQSNPSEFLEWTRNYSTQDACLKELNRSRWGIGLVCLKYELDKSYQLKYYHLHKTADFNCQVLSTAGTIFDHSRMPLTKWFLAVYLTGADKDRISVQWLSKTPSVDWQTAYRTLSKLCIRWSGRAPTGLNRLVKAEGAFVDGHSTGMRGLGAEGKKSVKFAVKHLGWKTDCMATCLKRVHSKLIRQCTTLNSSNSEVCTDAFQASQFLRESHQYFLKYINEFVLRFSITDSGNHSYLKGCYWQQSTMCRFELP